MADDLSSTESKSDSNRKLSKRQRKLAAAATLRILEQKLQKRPVTHKGRHYDSLECLWNSKVQSADQSAAPAEMPAHDEGIPSSTASASGSKPSAESQPTSSISPSSKAAPRVVPALRPVENPAPKSGRRRGKRAGQNVFFYNALHALRNAFQ